MNLYDFAKTELELAGLLNEKEDFHSGLIGKSVLELIQIIESQQHTTETKKLTADFFWKLCNNRPLNYLSDGDNEWIKKDDILVHKRCDKLEKDQDGRVWYTEAIAFFDDYGVWTGTAWLSKEAALANDKSKIISSKQQVKSFPFEAKTIWVEVTPQEVGDQVQPIITGSMEKILQKYELDII